MPDTVTTNSPIIAAYRALTPGSAARAERAAALFPSGITHDSRYIEPYGLYIERAAGPRKWDVDGRSYVDYFGGHGALLLGHCHPEVMAAVHAQLDRGTHFGASHELELLWAESVMRLVPSAERVRFTSSGTEATLMAVRLARAFTGKPKLVRFNQHFHGWHDHMTSGHASHFDGTATAGVLDAVAGNVRLCDQNDEAALAALLDRHDDIAAAIIEPTGANGGKLPIDPAFLQALRRLTQERGVLLIFDEVVTGFRVSPGGAQAATVSGPISRASPRSSPAGCRAVPSPAARTSSICWIFRSARMPAGKKSGIRAPTTPTRSPPPPASPRCASSPRAMPASAPTALARRCAAG